MKLSRFSDTSKAYDDIAQLYSDLFLREIDKLPEDRAMLAAFAERVGPGGTVLDAGCGPGYITAHLAALGLDASGMDGSPTFIDMARQHFPHHTYAVGNMTQLEHGDESLDGIVSRFSTIHTPPDELDAFFSEFARVLKPGGRLLIGFFATNEPAEHGLDFDHQAHTAYQFDPDQIAAQLAPFGLREGHRLVRKNQPDERRQFPSATLSVRKDT